MTPGQQIVATAMQEGSTKDSRGRVLKYRQLGALDRARLFKAAGSTHSTNAPYIGMSMIAASCTSIDGIPQPFPTRENEIDAFIARLGDEGMDAIAEGLVGDAMATDGTDSDTDNAAAAESTAAQGATTAA